MKLNQDGIGDHLFTDVAIRSAKMKAFLLNTSKDFNSFYNCAHFMQS